MIKFVMSHGLLSPHCDRRVGHRRVGRREGLLLRGSARVHFVREPCDACPSVSCSLVGQDRIFKKNGNSEFECYFPLMTFPTKVPSDSLGWIGSLKRTSDKSLFPMALG